VLGLDRSQHGGQGCFVRDVAGCGDDPVVGAGGELVERVRGSCDRHDGRAGIGEVGGETPAEPGRGSGHDRDLIIEALLPRHPTPPSTVPGPYRRARCASAPTR
jgi:hypothetical protein